MSRYLICFLIFITSCDIEFDNRWCGDFMELLERTNKTEEFEIDLADFFEEDWDFLVFVYGELTTYDGITYKEIDKKIMINDRVREAAEGVILLSLIKEKEVIYEERIECHYFIFEDMDEKGFTVVRRKDSNFKVLKSKHRDSFYYHLETASN
ncbi:MAG: hypothetical protein AAGI38_21350 [Bacteroidota bacterium]